MSFSLRNMLASQPADEQPPRELVVRMEALLAEVGDLLDEYPRPWGGGSLEDQDLRLELNSADNARHVVIQLGESVEYIYYSYREFNTLGDPKLCKVKKPVTGANLRWVLEKLAELAQGV